MSLGMGDDASSRLDMLEQRVEKGEVRLSLAEELLRLKKSQELNQSKAEEDRFQIVWDKLVRVEQGYSGVVDQVQQGQKDHQQHRALIANEYEQLQKLVLTHNQEQFKTVTHRLNAIEDELEKNRTYTVKGHHLITNELGKVTRQQADLRNTLTRSSNDVTMRMDTVQNSVDLLEARLTELENENKALRAKDADNRNEMMMMSESINKLLKVNEFAAAQKRINIRNERSIELLHDEMKQLKQRLVTVLAVFNTQHASAPAPRSYDSYENDTTIPAQPTRENISLSRAAVYSKDLEDREVTLKGNDIIALIDNLRRAHDVTHMENTPAPKRTVHRSPHKTYGQR